MLLKDCRFTQFFDFVMLPSPREAPAIPLADVMDHLENRVKSEPVVLNVDNDRRTISLTKTRRLRTGNDEPAMAMLFHVGDKSKSSPGFFHLQRRTTRTVNPEENEAGGLSAHLVVCLSPTEEGGFVYRAVAEEVRGLGRSLMQTLLRNEFGAICKEYDFHYEREKDGKKVKTRPLVELENKPSEQIKASLSEGRLLGIELIKHENVDFGFDDPSIIATTKTDLNIKVSKQIPKSDELATLDRLKAWARSNDYGDMYIRWKDNEVGKHRSAKVDVERDRDVADAFFSRVEKISVSTPLGDMSNDLHTELVQSMAKAL